MKLLPVFFQKTSVTAFADAGRAWCEFPVAGSFICPATIPARTTLASVFGQLSSRITDLRVVSEPDVEPNIFARAVRSFELGFGVR